MSDKTLRSALIRLAASSTPEVKAAILPILKKTAGSKLPPNLAEAYDEAGSQAIGASAALERLTRLLPFTAEYEVLAKASLELKEAIKVWRKKTQDIAG